RFPLGLRLSLVRRLLRLRFAFLPSAAGLVGPSLDIAANGSARRLDALDTGQDAGLGAGDARARAFGDALARGLRGRLVFVGSTAGKSGQGSGGNEKKDRRSHGRVRKHRSHQVRMASK